MKEINIAVIGWGFMGRMHTHSLRSIPLMYKNIDFKPVLKCICSGHMDNALAAVRDAGFESATDDWHTLLDRDDIDAVSVCTPNGLHEEMVTALMRAGKALYIDKPLTTDLESALRIQAAAKETHATVQMVMNNRFLPSTMRAKQLVMEGRIGEVTQFSARYLHSGSLDANKPIGWKQGLEGGVLLDLGSHALDLVTDLVGFPASVICAENSLFKTRPTKDGGKTDALSEDHALLLMRLNNGALGVCEASKIATGANDELQIEVCGTKGALRFDLMDSNWLHYYDATQPDGSLGGCKGWTRIECVGRYDAPAGSFPPSKNSVGWDRGHIHCYYSFLECLAHGKTPVPGIDDAVKLQRLMQAAKESASSGLWTEV